MFNNCFQAAVVLGQPIATFPAPEFRLSALPSTEKERLLEDRSGMKAVAYTPVQFIPLLFKNMQCYSLQKEPTKFLRLFKSQHLTAV